MSEVIGYLVLLEERICAGSVYYSFLSIGMASPPTVGELRNDIRREVGRFECRDSPTFTKEDLAAICETAGYEINTKTLPAKAEMGAGILRSLDTTEDTPDAGDHPFPRAELESIHTALKPK